MALVCSRAFHIDTFNSQVFIITWALTPPQTQTLNKMSCNCILACLLIKPVLWNSTSVEWSGGVWRLLEWFIDGRGKPCSGKCCPVIQHIFSVCIKSNSSPSVHALASLFALVAESNQKLTSASLNILSSSHPSFNPSLPHIGRMSFPSSVSLPSLHAWFAEHQSESYHFKKSWPCPQTTTQIAHTHHTCHSNVGLVESAFHHLFGPVHSTHLSCCPCHWLMGTVKKSPRSHVAATVTSGKRRRGGWGGVAREGWEDRQKQGGWKGRKTKLWWCDRFLFF